MSAPVRILLTGASGCVGRAVLAAAAREPGRYEIVAVYRSSAPEAAPGVTPLRAELHELPGALAGVGPLDACIHAAAAVHGAEPDPAQIFAVNRDQTLALAAALRGHPGFRRFVFVSTIGVLETGGPDTWTPYAASKAEAETALAEGAQGGAFELTVLRLATVYGPHDRGNIGALFRQISRRRYGCVAPAGTPKTLVSSRRAAAAALAAAAGDAPGQATWLVADPEPYGLGRIENALAEAAGVPAPPRLPRALAWTAAAAGSALSRVGLRAPITLGRLRTLERATSLRPSPPEVGEALREVDGRSLAEAFRDAYVHGIP